LRKQSRSPKLKIMLRKTGIRIERRIGNFRVVEVAYAPHDHRQRTDCPDYQLWLAQSGGWTSMKAGQTTELVTGGTSLYLPGEPCRQRVAPVGAMLLSVQIPASALETGYRIRRSGLALGLARVQQTLWQTDSSLQLEENITRLIDSCLPPESHAPRWLNRVCERLNDDYACPLTLAELAAEAGVHSVHLATTFRARVGCTIGSYLRTLRLEAALRCLTNTNDDLATIACQVGFYDHAHLTRLFRREIGVPPALFRQRLRA
jgi:AraC-like DNA-binding protein